MRSIKCLILGLAFTMMHMCMGYGQSVDSLSPLEIAEGKILNTQLDKQDFSNPGKTILRSHHHAPTFILKSKKGIFCRWEDRIIQRSKVPIHFRLGSLSYADQMEGKWKNFQY